MGGFTSTVRVALAGFALERRIVYLATMALTDELAGARGNRYTFTLRPSAAIQASMLLPEALKLAKRRWAIVYPHNMYDYAAIQSFRMRLMHEQPSVDIVYEQVVAHALKEVNVAARTGPLQWRKDHRSTLGAFVGQLDASPARWPAGVTNPGERHARSSHKHYRDVAA